MNDCCSNIPVDTYTSGCSVRQAMNEYLNKWNESFGELNEDKKLIVKAVINAFRFASLAYSSFLDETKNAKTRASASAGFAYSFCANVKFAGEKLGLKGSELIEKIEETCAWLARKGWNTIPTIRDKDGSIVTKTARGVADDMIYFRKSFADACLREERGESGPAKASKTENDSSYVRDCGAVAKRLCA